MALQRLQNWTGELGGFWNSRASITFQTRSLSRNQVQKVSEIDILTPYENPVPQFKKLTLRYCCIEPILMAGREERLRIDFATQNQSHYHTSILRDG